MKFRPIVYIIPAVVLVAAMIIGSSLLFRVFVLLLIAGLIALIWVWSGLRGLRITTGEIPAYCHAGDKINNELTVNNDSVLPKLLLKIEEKSTVPGYQNLSMINLPGHLSHSWENEISFRRRGWQSIGPVSVTSSDPFGLFSRSATIGKPRNIIVYPRIVDLPLFRTSMSSLVDLGRGISGRRISQISPSASNVREMVSGDSQEHIHWRSTAHTGKLMVKVFDAEHSSEETKDAWIVLDMDRSVHFGQDEESTEEYCVTAAASLLRKYLDEGMRVGFKASSEQAYSLSPNSGNAHFLSILERLALIEANGQKPIGDLIIDPESFGNEHNTVVVVTPDSDEFSIDAMRRLRNYGHSVVAIFVDASSFGGKLNPEQAVHSLATMGIQAYIIRKGDNMSRALDSTTAIWYSRYA